MKFRVRKTNFVTGESEITAENEVKRNSDVSDSETRDTVNYEMKKRRLSNNPKPIPSGTCTWSLQRHGSRELYQPDSFEETCCKKCFETISMSANYSKKKKIYCSKLLSCSLESSFWKI